MTRTVTRRPLTPIGLTRPRHGHKRKGKPVESWKKDLQQHDENSDDINIRRGNLNAIEQIADGVERMMSSWNLDTFERGQKQAKIFHATNNSDTLLVTRDDDDAHSSAGKASHIKLSVQDEVPGPLHLTHEKSISCSVVETLAAFETPVCHHEVNVGTVKRDLAAACEKNVGTEAMEQNPGTNKVVMTDFSPCLSFREVSPSPDAHALPPAPVERNYYPGKENSCSYQSSTAERQLQLSPRKEEPHAQTLTHSFLNCVDHGRHSETHVGVDRATHVDVMAEVAAHAHSAKAHGLYSPRLNSGAMSHSSSYYWPCHIQTLEVGGRPVTMPELQNGTEVLRKKFESLINITSDAPLIQERSCLVPSGISSVEELQLALIECATEYEIQTLDARMNMHGRRAQKRQITNCEFDQLASSHENQNHNTEIMSRFGGAKASQSQYALQRVRREVMKPENIIIRPSTQPWKKKERLSPELKKSENGIRAFSRLFDRQRRSLDDALNHVDRLQREVLKKDRELVEWQLKEKETKTQVHELEDKVKKSQVLLLSPRLEPRKLFLALPALRESLRALKVEEQKKIPSPLAETAQEPANLRNKSMNDQDYYLNSRLQCLEEGTSEMNELKSTMSKLASNMAELSMAFKDHVQFVNHRLKAIQGHVMKMNVPANKSSESVPSYATNPNAVRQLKLAAVEAVEAEREITRSPSSY